MYVTRYKSEGVLTYSIEPTVGHKLSLIVDEGLASTYRALVPKAVRLQRPRWPAHISVIRKEPIPNLDLWGKHEGENVPFEYEPIIYWDETYYWLRCFSPRLIAIRRELGLEDLSELASSPARPVRLVSHDFWQHQNQMIPRLDLRVLCMSCNWSIAMWGYSGRDPSRPPQVPFAEALREYREKWSWRKKSPAWFKARYPDAV